MLRFSFGGANFQRDLKKKVLGVAREDIEARVRRIRCPAHHQAARIRFTGTSTNLTWSVDGCCDALIERVKKELG